MRARYEAGNHRKSPEATYSRRGRSALQRVVGSATVLAAVLTLPSAAGADTDNNGASGLQFGALSPAEQAAQAVQADVLLDQIAQSRVANAAAAEVQQKKAEEAAFEAKVHSTPPEIDPYSFGVGQFIGGVMVNYAPYSTDTSSLSAEQIAQCRQGQMLDDDAAMAVCFELLRTEYMATHGANYRGDTISHDVLASRLVGGNSYLVDPWLDNGYVMPLVRNANNNLVVLAGHNITPINAPVEIDGTVYDQSMLGINKYMANGTKVRVVVPSSDQQLAEAGYATVYEYEITQKTIVNYEQDPDAAAEQVFADPSNDTGDSRQVLRIYDCWPPGSSQYRIVYEGRLAASSWKQTTVALPTGLSVLYNPDVNAG